MNEQSAFSRQVRLKCLRLSHENRASHLGGAFSVADILAVLYGAPVLKFNPHEPAWPDRDRLFYSKGHACTALYATLQQVGYYDGVETQFTKNGSYFTSHVNHKVPGVELSTGSLGHALPVATGVALAAHRRKHSWRTYCITSDGELDEGSNWEAILFAAHHRLEALTLVVDVNKIQSFGTTEQVCRLEPLEAKFEAFGWTVARVDGHDHSALFEAFAAPAERRPKVILADTIKGKGVSFMENQLAWHYKSPNAQEYELAKAELESR